MPEQELAIRVKVLEDGSIVLLDRTNQAVGRLGDTAEQTSKKTVSGFSRIQAAIVTVNQATAFLNRTVSTTTRAVENLVRPAIDFESGFTGVRKTVEATEGQFQGLSRQLRQLDSELPIATQDILATAEAAGQLGIQTDSIVEFTKVMSTLGVTTDLAAREAAVALARLAVVTKLPQDQFDNLASSVVALGNNFAAFESEITEFALRIGGAGTQIGLTQAEILGLAAGLASVGLRAEAAGTSISLVFVAIEKAVEKANEDLATFAELAGRSTGEFSRLFREDTAEAVLTVIEGIGRLDESGGSVVLTLEKLGLDARRVADLLKRTANAGLLLRDAIDLGTISFEENVAASREAAQRFATTESQILLLSKQWTALRRDAMLPFLREINTAIANVREWVDANKPMIEDTIAGGWIRFTGVVEDLGAALGPVARDAIIVIDLLNKIPDVPASLRPGATIGRIFDPESFGPLGAIARLEGFLDSFIPTPDFVGPTIPMNLLAERFVEANRAAATAVLEQENVEPVANAIKQTEEQLTDLFKAQTLELENQLSMLQNHLALKRQLTVEDELGLRITQADLTIAKEIDALEREAVNREIEELQRKSDAFGITKEEGRLLDAQIQALVIRRDTIGITAGEELKLKNLIDQSTESLKELSTVTADLGGIFGTSIQRSLTGILSGGETSFFEGAGLSIAQEFIGGLVAAESAKGAFDVSLSENFQVRIPGFVKSGATAMAEFFGLGTSEMVTQAAGASDEIEGTFGGAFQGIVRGAAGAVNGLTGLLRNIPGLGSLFRRGAATVLPDQTTAEALSGFITPSAVFEAGSTPGQPSAASTAFSGLGVGLGTGGFLASLGSLLPEAGLGTTLGTTLGGGIGGVIGAFAGSPLLGAILGSVAGGVIGFIADLFSSNRPIGTGGGEFIGNIFRDANIPQFIFPGQNLSALRFGGFARPFTQTELEFQRSLGATLPGGLGTGDPALISQILASSANELRSTTALATSLAIPIAPGASVPTANEAFRGANLLATNAALLGLSERETNRTFRRFLAVQGVNDLNSALDLINNRFLTTDVSADATIQAIQGAIDLFHEDLPAGVDASAIAIQNFSETGGLQVADFNEELERSIEIFGALEQTITSGTTEAIRAFAETLDVTVNDVLSGVATIDEAVKAVGDAQVAFFSAIFTEIGDGLKTAITEATLDIIKETDAFKALQDAVAAAVTTGEISILPGLIGDVFSASLPVLETAAAAFAEINRLLSITPTAILQGVQTIRDQIDAERRAAALPSRQGNAIRNELAEIDAELARLTGDSIPDTEQAGLIVPLLQRKAGLGFDLVDLSDQRFDPLSVRGRQEREEGLRIAQEASDDLEQFGLDQRDAILATTELTTATEQNTDAVNGLTEAITEIVSEQFSSDNTPSGSPSVTVNEDGTITFNIPATAMASAVNHTIASRLDPRARAALREQVHR